AGAYEELGDDAIVVNPYDVSATADALHEALTMADGERAERTEYTAEVRRVADEINAKHGTADWTPVVLHVKDDFARSLAAYRL
ncbi:trehalose-6-phosphate synthase, partial [Streptomyces sp. AC154]|uniref:trehalose-6-phosphate synthase n=1 Tax=Streptomyces sp. AC154 TaxID=3143184 RepID=UPI003F7FD0CA